VSPGLDLVETIAQRFRRDSMNTISRSDSASLDVSAPRLAGPATWLTAFLAATGLGVAMAAKIEADGDYVIAHAGTANHRVRQTITAMEARLPSEQLIRVSRSAIVNIGAVAEIQPWFRGNFVILLRSGARVTTGARYRDRIARRL
jgi:hypothetical protein